MPAVGKQLNVELFVANEAINRGEVVSMLVSGTNKGQVRKTRGNSDVTSNAVLGVAVTDAAAGAKVSVDLFGDVKVIKVNNGAALGDQISFPTTGAVDGSPTSGGGANAGTYLGVCIEANAVANGLAKIVITK